ncbi:MAG: FAD-dependent oxidoreductase [Candidatus Binatia bacterium]
MKSGRYDVVVAGGGSAGIAAAVAASRVGARTLLLERYGFLGGMATAGMVGTVCGLYLTRAEGPPERLNEGLTGELADGLARLPGTEPPLRRGRTFVVPYVPHELAGLADDLTAAEPALDVRLHAYLTGVTTGAGAVTGVRFASWEGPSEVECGAVVDASGDAVAALAAGAASETPAVDARQLCSLVFTLQGVAPAAVRGAPSLATLRRIGAAEAAGKLAPGSSDLGWRPTSRPGEVVAKLALRDLADGSEGDWLTAAERAARRRVAALLDFLRREVPAFAGAFVSHLAPQVGVRESRRIIGRSGLTRDDVLGGRRRDDAAARASWPIELWREGAAGAQYAYLADGDWYDIPLGCLEATGVTRLFAAGRCISGTSEALGSARVIGTCLATGEAAGRAAARVAAAP